LDPVQWQEESEPRLEQLRWAGLKQSFEPGSFLDRQRKLEGKEDSEFEEVKNKLDFITDKLDSLTSGKGETADPISEYLDHAKQTIDSKQGFFYIAATPATPVKMNNFWDKDKNLIYDLLLDPPTLRRSWPVMKSFINIQKSSLELKYP